MQMHINLLIKYLYMIPLTFKLNIFWKEVSQSSKIFIYFLMCYLNYSLPHIPYILAYNKHTFEARKLIKIYRCMSYAEQKNESYNIKHKNQDFYINEEQKKKK